MSKTGADLPPELFAAILYFTGTDNAGRWVFGQSVTADLKACSLVCLYWANISRKYIFTRERLTIKSLEELVTLESYAKSKTSRLVPLHSLIRHITVVQDWQSPSWYYRLNSSLLFQGLRTADSSYSIAARLIGPVPAHLPLAAVRSPHWSLPRSLPPSVLPLFQLWLDNIKFPSLSDACALLGQITAQNIYLDAITWDTADLPAAARSRLHHTIPTETVQATNCKDNVLVSSLVYRQPGRCALFQWMIKAEVDAYLAFLRSIRTNVVKLRPSYVIGQRNEMDPNSPASNIPGRCFKSSIAVDVRIGEHVSTAGFRTPTFHAEIIAHCTTDPSKTVLSTITHISGLTLELRSDAREYPSDEIIEFAAGKIQWFQSKLVNFPHLRVAEVVSEMDIFRRLLAKAPDLYQPPPPRTFEYVWVCSRDQLSELPSQLFGYRRIGVDPTTLEPSGQCWGFNQYLCDKQRQEMEARQAHEQQPTTLQESDNPSDAVTTKEEG